MKMTVEELKGCRFLSGFLQWNWITNKIQRIQWVDGSSCGNAIKLLLFLAPISCSLDISILKLLDYSSKAVLTWNELILFSVIGWTLRLELQRNGWCYLGCTLWPIYIAAAVDRLLAGNMYCSIAYFPFPLLDFLHHIYLWTFMHLNPPLYLAYLYCFIEIDCSFREIRFPLEHLQPQRMEMLFTHGNLCSKAEWSKPKLGKFVWWLAVQVCTWPVEEIS